MRLLPVGDATPTQIRRAEHLVIERCNKLKYIARDLEQRMARESDNHLLVRELSALIGSCHRQIDTLARASVDPLTLDMLARA